MRERISRAQLTGAMLVRFGMARWGRRFRSRAAFDAWQERRVQRFRRRLVAAPFYRALLDANPGRRPVRLPVVDKTVHLEHFDGLNTRGIRLADALGVALEAEQSRDFSPTVGGDLTVGLSSGTSGRRGVFLVSPRERMLWAGTVLGRLLDAGSVRRLLLPWRPPLRIAFFLRAGGGLYESVASSRVRFTFFDLTESFDAHLAELQAAVDAGRGPDVLVAPASVLDALARRADSGELRIRPRLVISVAEVLEPDTASRVELAWGRPPRQVYQATEGLLALSCRHGALHLNEETVRFEREWQGEGRTRFVPIVTDFERSTQLVVRYRLDDVLRVDPSAPERCACGRVTTVLAGVDGREDSVLRLPSIDGRAMVEVFPDAVRRAMAVGSAGYADWRIRQRGLDVHVRLDEPAPGAPKAVTAALESLFSAYGCHAAVVHAPWEPEDPAHKRRRILREVTP